MSRPFNSIALKYAYAAGVTLLAAWVRSLLSPAIGPYAIPFATFFVAVAAVAWLGGLGPALSSVALASALAAFLFMPPAGLATTVNQISLVVFMAAGTALALFSEGLRRERRRAFNMATIAGQQTESLNVTLRSIGDAVITTDAAGRITLINSVAQRVTGWTEQEALGRDVWDVFRVIEEESRASQQPRIAAVLTERRPISLANHTLLIRRDGSEIAIDDSGAPIITKSGELAGAVLVFRDVTERRRVRRELEASESRFRTVADAAPVMIWRSGPDGQRTYFNKPWLDFRGTTLEQEIRAGWEAVHPDDRDRCVDEYGGAFEGRHPFRMEYRLQRGDGAFGWVLDSGVPLYGPEGEFQGYIGSCLEITERKQAEQNLQRSEENLRLALAAGRMGTWSRVGNQIRWSPELETLFGVAPGSFRGTEETFLELIHSDDRQHVRDSIALVNSGQRDYELEFRVPRSNGSVAWMYSRGRAESDETGAIVRRAGITMDITEQKRLELELRQQSEELSRSNQDLEQFTYLSSHDLQEPLRTVAVYVQMLERRYGDRLDGDAPQFIEFIVSNVRRMQAQINALLEYSRVGREHIQVEEVDANKSFDDALAAIQANIEATGAEITHDPLPCVLADPQELTRVFQNLLSNGIQFRKPGEAARIHVTAEQENASWLFSVHDNGIGIDPEYQQRIFEIFRRLNRHDEGTGIGLAVCKRIVERSGGRIWVESSPGKGATFKFTVPAVPHLAVASIPHSA